MKYDISFGMLVGSTLKMSIQSIIIIFFYFGYLFSYIVAYNYLTLYNNYLFQCLRWRINQSIKITHFQY